MTTNSTTAKDRLAKRGIHLPDAPTPFGANVPPDYLDVEMHAALDNVPNYASAIVTADEIVEAISSL